MKKMLSLVLVFILVLGLSVPAFAINVSEYPAITSLFNNNGDVWNLGDFPVSELDTTKKAEWDELIKVFNGTHPNKNLVPIATFALSYNGSPQTATFLNGYLYAVDKTSLKFKNISMSGLPQKYFTSNRIIQFPFAKNSNSSLGSYFRFQFSGSIPADNYYYHSVLSGPYRILFYNPSGVDFSSTNYLTDIPHINIVDDSAKPVAHNLTVKYLYDDGSIAADSVTKSLKYNDTYSITSPQIAGFAPDLAILNGTMPDSDTTVTVTYSRTTKDYLLTVNYLFTDFSIAAPKKELRLSRDASYHIESPKLEGFKPDISLIFGRMPENDLELSVSYSAIGDSGGGESGDGGGSDGGGSGGNNPGGGGSSGGTTPGGIDKDYVWNDPFVKPDFPPYTGNDPFAKPEFPPFSGNDPFKKPELPPFTGKDPSKKHLINIVNYILKKMLKKMYIVVEFQKKEKGFIMSGVIRDLL